MNNNPDCHPEKPESGQQSKSHQSLFPPTKTNAMAPKELKVGKKYKLELTCICVQNAVIVFETPTGSRIPLYYRDIECVSPANGTKNAEPSPKYDPCRKFRKGDIVEPRKGREVYACEWDDAVFHKLEGTYEVQYAEKQGHVTVLEKETGVECYVSVFALELVTPVEEREPYSVETCQYGYTVNKGEDILATYNDEKHPHAKAAAEAECDRLNDEWRKEQK